MHVLNVGVPETFLGVSTLPLNVESLQVMVLPPTLSVGLIVIVVEALTSPLPGVMTCAAAGPVTANAQTTASPESSPRLVKDFIAILSELDVLDT
jgi:hypothetical protein